MKRHECDDINKCINDIKVIGVEILSNGNNGWRMNNGIFICECIGGPYAKAIAEFISDKYENIAALELRIATAVKIFERSKLSPTDCEQKMVLALSLSIDGLYKFIEEYPQYNPTI